MVLSVFMTLAVTLAAGYLIWRVAKKAWRSSDVDTKLDEVQALEENYHKVEDLNLEDIKEKKHKLDEVLKS